MGGNGSHSPGVERDFSSSFFVGLGREEIKVCDAFLEQEMSPWSNAATWLEKPVLKDFTLVIIWVATTYLMPPEIQMIHLIWLILELIWLI